MALRKTKNSTKAEVREKVAPMLQAALTSAIDLSLQAKQAHWNVRGPGFIGIHELFDKAAAQAQNHADDIAERLVQLGGTAMGRAKDVSKGSALKEYPGDISAQEEHVDAFSTALADFASQLRELIQKAEDAGDPDTADLFTSVSRDTEKMLWFVESHLG